MRQGLRSPEHRAQAGRQPARVQQLPDADCRPLFRRYVVRRGHHCSQPAPQLARPGTAARGSRGDSPAVSAGDPHFGNSESPGAGTADSCGGDGDRRERVDLPRSTGLPSSRKRPKAFSFCAAFCPYAWPEHSSRQPALASTCRGVPGSPTLRAPTWATCGDLQPSGPLACRCWGGASWRSSPALCPARNARRPEKVTTSRCRASRSRKTRARFP